MDIVQISKGLGMTDALAEKPQTGASPTSQFSDALRNAVDDVSRLQQTANKTIQNVQTGDASLHEAMIALEKADISFRTMLQFRNKFIEAYQEVMRLQV